MVIDTHTHFLPRELIELLGQGAHPAISILGNEGNGRWLRYESGMRFPLQPSFYDVTAKLEHMDAAGVDVGLISIAAPLFLYDLDPADTVALSKVINDAAASMAAASGGRIRGMATIPLNAPDEAAAELRRAHGELGLRGVEVGTSVGTTMLDAPELDAVWAVAAELEIPVFLHPHLSMSGEGRPIGVDRYFMSNSVGNPLETHTAAARLILGGVFDRFPGLTVQLAHGGGALPYQLARLDRTYVLREEVREVAERRPLDYVRNFLFDTVVYHDVPLDFLIEFVGADRVVFGTDWPFDMEDVTGLRVAERLAAAEAERILAGNARQAYGL
jgi:aminocarboxymuconate-semialdehyde decarboxylase